MNKLLNKSFIASLIIIGVTLQSTLLLAICVCLAIGMVILKFVTWGTLYKHFRFSAKGIYPTDNLHGVDIYTTQSSTMFAGAGIDFIIVGVDTPDVIALHEVGHVKNGDAKRHILFNIATILIYTLVTITAMFINISPLIPLIGFLLLDMAIKWESRRCEYRADEYAAKYSGVEETTSALMKYPFQHGNDLFSTHPCTVNRMANIVKLMEEKPEDNYPEFLNNYSVNNVLKGNIDELKNSRGRLIDCIK